MPPTAQWHQHRGAVVPDNETVEVLLPWKFPDPLAGVAPVDVYKARELAQLDHIARRLAPKNRFGLLVAKHLHLDLHESR